MAKHREKNRVSDVILLIVILACAVLIVVNTAANLIG